MEKYHNKSVFTKHDDREEHLFDLHINYWALERVNLRIDDKRGVFNFSIINLFFAAMQCFYCANGVFV